MAAFGITATTALASPGPVSTGKQVCKASGQAVVNVHYTYTSPDSGVGVERWADDIINRQLQIWKLADGYCASVSDQGSFVTVAGPAPGGSGNTVSDGITGKLKGGYTTTRLTLTDPDAGFNPSKLATRGDLGSYIGDARPSFVSYGLSGDLAKWGWVYQTANNGTWTNSVDGNSGDIPA